MYTLFLLQSLRDYTHNQPNLAEVYVLRCFKLKLWLFQMMSCSFLSAAGMAPESSGAACWTPPSMSCLPGMEGPSSMMPPYVRPPSLLGLPCMPAPPTFAPAAAGAPGPSHEPALDLTKPSSSLKCHLPSPASDGETEWQCCATDDLLNLRHDKIITGTAEVSNNLTIVSELLSYTLVPTTYLISVVKMAIYITLTCYM